MTHRFSLFLLLGLLLVSPQLSAGGEPRYPVWDSKVPVDEQTHPVWLNNSQVIFMGYELDPTNPPKQIGLAWEIPRGVYVWDLQKGTAVRDHSWDGTNSWCVSGEYRSFHRLRSGTDKTYDLVQGKVGEEQVQTLPAKHWFNKISCHYYTSLPYWRVEGKQNQSLPLLEKHGYLDFGVPIWVDPSGKDKDIILYKQNPKQSVNLPLTGRQVEFQTSYAEFADAYVLKGKQRTSDAVPVWQLNPDSTLMKILDPKGRDWERIGWGNVNLTKKGLFLVGGRAGYDTVGTAGAYLFVNDHPLRLIAGLVWNESVSPDGCKVAFVYVMHSLAGTESVQALRQGKPGTRTLKIIDLCEGKGE
jgi:hypothetical protein